MSAQTPQKKLFFIAATDKKDSLNRTLINILLELFKKDASFNTDYSVQTHVQLNGQNIYSTLEDAIRGDEFEGYLILLDTLDNRYGIFNPNVMFEFGAIMNLGRPFAVMSTGTHDPSEYPFDVKGMRVEPIPKVIINYAKDAHASSKTINVLKWYKDLSGKEQTEIEEYFLKLLNNYQVSLHEQTRDKNHTNKIGDKLDELTRSHEVLKSQIGQLALSFSNTADYIDGEAAAFIALSNEVKKAQYSLRTTRFANQSIVREATKEQRIFMDALYEKSKELNGSFVRIICNNHPAKWCDIYNILLHGGNKSRVYVRKSNFSIYFELVVIDERVAFVHFYQQDHAKENAGNKNDIRIEKINSTLKIQGSSICIKFAKIFDRLHHRDFEASTPQDPSRTLLGIPQTECYDQLFSQMGYFELPENAPGQFDNPSLRQKMILNLFKKAFKKWDIHDKDKLNMAVGIALLENSSSFIDKMHDEAYLSDREYADAQELFKNNYVSMDIPQDLEDF